MINPRLLEAKYKAFRSPRFAGGKVYFPFVGRPTRVFFRRASEALEYARRARERWIRLYDAAIVALAEPAMAGARIETMGDK